MGIDWPERHADLLRQGFLPAKEVIDRLGLYHVARPWSDYLDRWLDAGLCETMLINPESPRSAVWWRIPGIEDVPWKRAPGDLVKELNAATDAALGILQQTSDPAGVLDTLLIDPSPSFRIDWTKIAIPARRKK